MSDAKITIFDILATIDNKDKDFYKDLPESVQKAEHPLILMKWMAGTSDRMRIMLLNEYINPYVFNLHKHKSLVMQMLTICGSGNRERYKWIKLKKTNTMKHPMLTSIVKQIFNYSTSHALDAIPLIPPAKFLEFANQLGLTKEDISKTKREIKQL